MEGLFQVQLQQDLSHKLPQPFPQSGNWKYLWGESCVLQSLVQSSWAMEVGASPGQLFRERARNVLSCQHREGCLSVPLGTDTLGHSHSDCGAGFVSALGWWRQPHLPCPAHTGAVAQHLVWPVLQVSAGQDLCPRDPTLSPRASGIVGMWDLWCTQLLALLTFAPTPGQEHWVAPGLGIILLIVVTMLCQHTGASAWPHCLSQFRNVCSRLTQELLGSLV